MNLGTIGLTRWVIYSGVVILVASAFGLWPVGVSGWMAFGYWLLLSILALVAEMLVAIRNDLSTIAKMDERVAEVNRRVMDIEHLLDMRLEKSKFE
jgi:hypothetical protein